MSRIYACFTTSYVHEGHLNIIKEALKYGELTIGVLSDVALAHSEKYSTFDQTYRLNMVMSLGGVSKVIIQDSIYYDEIINELNPDYVIHGDNWNYGPMKAVRDRLLKKIENTKCKLIEVPYTVNVESKKIDLKFQLQQSMPENRRPKLKRLVQLLKSVKVMEAHNGLSGLIVEKTVVPTDRGFQQYDAIWVSSLTDSTIKGKPDIELVDMTSRVNTISEIMEVTTKPIILDGDTGGLLEHFVFNIKTLERIGVSAIIIEDKTGLKRNSLFGQEVEQTQEDPYKFAEKIKAGKSAQLTDEFMIIARIESFILGVGIDDALMRAKIYIDAGADGIMIHSKSQSEREVFDFVSRFRLDFPDALLVVVPTTYGHVTFDEFKKHGANVIIYANHLLRSAYPSMVAVADRILRDGKTENIEESLMSIKDILTILEN